MPPRRRRNRNPRYLGLNLAWAPRNPSGGAVIEATEEGIKLISTTSLRAHEDILAWIARNRGRQGAVLASTRRSSSRTPLERVAVIAP